MKAEITIGGKTHEEIAVRAAVPADAAGVLASAEGYLYAAKGDNGLWGHIDEMGNWVIPPKFDSAGDFRGNYAWIQQGDREGFANRDGEIVLLLDENVVADSGYDGFYYGGRETGIWLLYKKATGKTVSARNGWKASLMCRAVFTAA